MFTVDRCFLLFFYHNQTHRNDKGSVNEATKIGPSNTFTLTLFCANMFFKIIETGQLKNTVIIQPKTQNSQTLIYFYIPPTYNTEKYGFFSIFAEKKNLQLYIYIHIYIYIYIYIWGGVSSFQGYFLMILYVTWFWFSEKIACGLKKQLFQPTNQKVLVFTYRQTRSPRKFFFNLTFKIMFYVAL